MKIIMKRFLLILIAVFCSLGLFVNQGYSAFMSDCCNRSLLQEMALGQLNHHETSCHSGHHAKDPLEQTVKQFKQQHQCQCRPASDPISKVDDTAFFSISDCCSQAPTLVQLFQPSDYDIPLWLYKLYYPDRSGLYLRNSRLLL